MKKKATAIRLRYLGLGYIVGIPARDLTSDEVEEYGGLKFLLSRQNGHGGKMFEKVQIKAEVSDGLRHDSSH